ncbi:hypothetical protein RJZ57_008172 [Blastomyces gilchristii]
MMLLSVLPQYDAEVRQLQSIFYGLFITRLSHNLSFFHALYGKPSAWIQRKLKLAGMLDKRPQLAK